jgi:hypothetical protein
MATKESIKLVVGSIAVYVIMAACSAGGGSPRSSPGLDGSASSGSGSGGNSGSGSDGSGVFDALTDPVTEAMAASPIIATENCNGTYAEHAFPGYTVNQLAFVHALINNAATIPGYSQYQMGAHLRDGYAAVASTSGTVTFILPQ